MGVAEGAHAVSALELSDPQPDGFTGALVSSGSSAELGKAADAFAWLIGGWAGDVKDIGEDGSVRTGTGEWWFSWARAVRSDEMTLTGGPRGSGRLDCTAERSAWNEHKRLPDVSES